jgi:hypothetical protein
LPRNLVFNGVDVRLLRRRNNAILVSALLLTATLNASQAMVLCQGNDGHVAIEPLGRDCCASVLQTDGSGAIRPQMVVALPGGAGCLFCVDTPIGGHTSDKPIRFSTPRVTGAASPVLCQPSPAWGATAANAMASACSVPTPADGAILSSIVLQV